MINPLSRIAGILLRPKTTFREAAGDPLWYGVSLYFLLVILGASIRILFPVVYNPAVPDAEMILRYEAVFSLITAFAGVVAGSGLLAIVLRIAGKKQTLRPAVMVFCYAGIPSALLQILLGVVPLLPVQGALPSGTVSIVETILWILVLVWTIVLIAIGLIAIPGLSAPGAAVCSIAEFILYMLCSAALVLPVIWIPLTSVTNLFYRLLITPVIPVVVFACYGLLEHKKLVQDEPDGWQDTQVASWTAIPVLAASFLYLPIWHHGGYTMMSQLSANLDMIPKYLSEGGNLYLHETEVIAAFCLVVLVYFLHATGIIGKRASLLAPVLSVMYLAFCGLVVSDWQGFYYSREYLNAEPGWGTWIVPLTGLIYFIIAVLSIRGIQQPPAQPPANCTPPDSVLAMMEPAASQKLVARDSFYLPPVTRTPPPPPLEVQKTAASSPAGTPEAQNSFYLPPVTCIPPAPLPDVPAAPSPDEPPEAPDPFSLLPVIPARPSPTPVVQQSPAPILSGPPDSPVTMPAAPAAVVRNAAPLLSGIAETPGLYTVRPSRTIALDLPYGTHETGPSFQSGEPGITGALRYAAAAMTGSLKRAFLLVLATLLLAVPLSGYLVRVMKGADPAPEVQGWAGLVIDGIKADFIVVLYTILTVVLVVLLGRSNLLWAGILLAAAVLYVLPAAVLCFARTGSLLAAFRPGSVTGAIGKIGWLAYTGFCILCLILNIGINFVYLIPYAGPALMVLLMAPLAIFEARYLALLAGRSGN